MYFWSMCNRFTRPWVFLLTCRLGHWLFTTTWYPHKRVVDWFVFQELPHPLIWAAENNCPEMATYMIGQKIHVLPESLVRRTDYEFCSLGRAYVNHLHFFNQRCKYVYHTRRKAHMVRNLTLLSNRKLSLKGWLLGDSCSIHASLLVICGRECTTEVVAFFSECTLRFSVLDRCSNIERSMKSSRFKKVFPWQK